MSGDDYASRTYDRAKVEQAEAAAMGRKAFQAGRIDAINDVVTKAEERGASPAELRRMAKAMGGKDVPYLPHQGRREMERRARRAAKDSTDA